MKKISSKLFSYLYLILFASLAFGQLTRFQISQKLSFTLYDLTNVTIIVSFLLYLLLAKTEFIYPKLARIPTLFLVFAFFSLFLNQFLSNSSNISSLLYLFRLIAQFLLFPITYHLIKVKLITKTELHTLYFVSFTVITLLGLLQYLIWPDTRLLFYLGWDDHLNRLIFPYLDPGFTGLILSFALIYFFHQSKKPIIIITLAIIALLLTYSRSSYLSLIFTVLVFGLVRSKLKYTLAVILLFIGSLFFLPRTAGEGVRLERLYSIKARIASLESGWQVLRAHPLIGIGFNNYPNYKSINLAQPDHANAPDNSLLFIAITTGIIGLSLYLFWIYQLLAWSFHKSSLFFTTLNVWIIHSFFNNSLFYSPANILIMLLLAYQLVHPTHSRTP